MRLRLWLTMALTVASLTVASTVQAAPAPAPAMPDAPVYVVTEAELAKVQALAPYFDNTTRTLDAGRALANGADAQTVRDFQGGMAKAKAALTVVSTQSTLAKASTTPSLQAVQTCVGSQFSVNRWGYYVIYLNSCSARSIVALLTIGAGLATVAGAIAGFTGIGLPYTAVAAVAAGLMSIGSGGVQWCNRFGRGIIARNIYWPPCVNQP